MQKILEQIGLTPTETKIYLALLETGESKVGSILSNAKLNSGRIYDVLEGLIQKGLVSTITRKGVKRYSPAPPTRIYELLEQQRILLGEHQKAFEKVLPELQKRFATQKSRVRVEVFFGAEGYRAANELMFTDTKDKMLNVYGLSAVKRYPQSLIDALRFYIYKKRKESGAKIRKLGAEEARIETVYDEDNSEIRYLPHPTVIEFQTYGDITLVGYNQEPLLTIIVHSKELTEGFRDHFDYLWKQAEK